MDVGLMRTSAQQWTLCALCAPPRFSAHDAVVGLPSCHSQQDETLIPLWSSVTSVKDAHRLPRFYFNLDPGHSRCSPLAWQQRPTKHGVDFPPENRSALWRSRASIPHCSSVSKAGIQQHTQGLDIRNACTGVHTSLHLSKSSRNEARQATNCSPALACASQLIPQCDGPSPPLPTNHRGLGWQNSFGLPALRVNVF